MSEKSEKSKKLKVSIVCTNYNKGTWIEDAIRSFLVQKTNFVYEILLIDDKSTDGSIDIIKKYQKQYPDKIKAFYNNKNLGITKTWIKICKEARGEYIARCDGDDYWIDDEKLQKQVDLLTSNKESKWCSTDYNIISPNGELVQRNAFSEGIVDRSNDYIHMLVNRGFTMSSTWLVETELMKEVNSFIDIEAVDDTFNIQLELFNKTKLSYLSESTVVYRINEGSDSRPRSLENKLERDSKLLSTQLEYVDRYKEYNNDTAKALLHRMTIIENWATERLELVNEQRNIIQEMEENIVHLQSALDAIRSSKAFKLYKIGKKIIKLPNKVLNKLNWEYDRLRYQKYYQTIKPSEVYLKQQAQKSKKFKYKPLISVIVPVYNVDEYFFNEMINSVKNQTYDNWELVLVDDASPNKNVSNWIKETAKKDKRIKYKILPKNLHIAGATNEGFRMAKGEFVSLLDHDDIIWPNALYEIVKALNKNKKLDFIYTDEDKIIDNKHRDPFLKPDWNFGLLLSINYITHFTTIRKSLVDKIGGERGEYNGAQDWDLIMRATRNTTPDKIHHIPKILYSWRIHPDSTADSIGNKPYVVEAQRRLLHDNLLDMGFGQEDFTIEQNELLPVAWNVDNVKDKTPQHTPRKDPDFDNLKGLALKDEEFYKNIGKHTMSYELYKKCKYYIQTEKSVSDE